MTLWTYGFHGKCFFHLVLGYQTQADLLYISSICWYSGYSPDLAHDTQVEAFHNAKEGFFLFCFSVCLFCFVFNLGKVVGQKENQGSNQAIGQYAWARAIAVADVQKGEISEEKIHKTVLLVKPDEEDEEDIANQRDKIDQRYYAEEEYLVLVEN